MRNIVLIILLYALSLKGLSQVADNSYRIFLTDKNNNGFSTEHPEEFLSQKAIERRSNQNIDILENDLPLTKTYTDSLIKLGCQVLNKSKWFNSIVIYTEDQALIDTITNLDFVKSKQKKASNLISHSNKELHKTTMVTEYYDALNYGNATPQISIHNGHILHQSNYLGQNMTIAIIDAGFYNVDLLAAFNSLWTNNQILGFKDFVDGDNNVFDASDHGMKVLSIMGANIPGEFIGTAPKANYWLLRSENSLSEYAIEEDNWVAAAEFADSVGADIINSSLGYSLFDDFNQNYSYNDLDGNTAFVTNAADIAASKGIIVVNSAGNSGNKPWTYISAPADADSILTVGAIDKYALYAAFSSIGPTSDGRIKPDIVAVGYQTTIQDANGNTTIGNGTSFSTPIITGLTACLWQSLPDLNNMEIIREIKASSHQYSNPDNKLGYGVPDFGKAANLTSIKPNFITNILINAYPNPFTKEITIDFISTINNSVSIELYDLIGKKVSHKYEPFIGEGTQIVLNNLQKIPSGVYLLKIKVGNQYINKKISKL